MQMIADSSQEAFTERYFTLQITSLEGDVLAEADVLADEFQPLVCHLISELVRQGVFRPDRCYDARIIPKFDHEANFDAVSVIQSSDMPNVGSRFVEIVLEPVDHQPDDPITYLTLQIRAPESDSAGRWDLRLDTYLREILTRIVQSLLDEGILRNGESFRFHLLVNKGLPRVRPVVAAKISDIDKPARFLEERSDATSARPNDIPGKRSKSRGIKDEGIAVTTISVEGLTTPAPRSMENYIGSQLIGQVPKQSTLIFLKRSARQQIHTLATISSETLEERGGILLGNAFLDPHSGRQFVEISQMIETRNPKATAVSLHFDYSFWQRVVNSIDRDFPDKIPVGWYHTHLVSKAVVLSTECANECIAEYRPFFSPSDVFIHRHFFPNPWQVALVMDLRCGYEAFFVWQEGNIVLSSGFYVYGE